MARTAAAMPPLCGIRIEYGLIAAGIAARERFFY
jgi:hypothetical protein